MKKIALISLAVLILLAVPMFASAADAIIDGTDSPYDLSANGHVAGDTITVTAGATMTIWQPAASFTPTMTIVCQPNVNLTAIDIGIDSTGIGTPGMDFTGGVNTLTIESTPGAGNGINGDNDRAGVRVAPAAFLTILGDGFLGASGQGGGAGIGGNDSEINGSITICLDDGGEIDASGGLNGGAGIGAGDNSSNGTIIFCTTNEGFVSAQGGTEAAGIGGARNGDGGTITIHSGEIEATGGSTGAGIGGGRSGDVGIIAINGGIVTAQGGTGGAGIGSGFFGDGGSITIANAEVYANGDIFNNNQDIGRSGFGGGAVVFGITGSSDVFLNNGIANSVTPTTTLPIQSLSDATQVPVAYNPPSGWAYPIGVYGNLLKVLNVANPQTGNSSSVWIIYACGIIVILIVVGILLMAHKKKIEKSKDKK